MRVLPGTPLGGAGMVDRPYEWLASHIVQKNAMEKFFCGPTYNVAIWSPVDD